MLHVRIASPPEVTGRLLETLTAHSGVLNLVVPKGAGRRPGGDAVQFDWSRGLGSTWHPPPGIPPGG